MSRVFLGQASTPETGSPVPESWALDLPDQFTAAERIARNRGITRQDVDAFGLASQRKAAEAWAAGRFDSQIVPVRAPVLESGSRPAGPPSSPGTRGCGRPPRRGWPGCVP